MRGQRSLTIAKLRAAAHKTSASEPLLAGDSSLERQAVAVGATIAKAIKDYEAGRVIAASGISISVAMLGTLEHSVQTSATPAC